MTKSTSKENIFISQSATHMKIFNKLAPSCWVSTTRTCLC